MRGRSASPWLFLVVFVVYALYFVITMLRPAFYITGDEVYYLTMTYSLWDDGDLDLRDEYAEESYRQFYPQVLTEVDISGHHLIGRQGELYSRHGLGLPLLMLPGWVVGKQVGVSLWLTAITAVLVVQLFGLLRQLFPDSEKLGWWGWLALVLSPPLTLYASLLFAEIPAALALTLALRYGLLAKERGNRWHTAVALMGVLALPWLNPRYALLVGPVAVVFWVQKRRWLALAAAISTLLPYLHFWVLLGYLPTLGDYGHVLLRVFPQGFFGLWLDREAGLVPYGPIYLLALFGVARSWMRRKEAVWGWWNLLWLPYLLFISAYDHWFGGWNPPARMMVPLVPLFAPLIALALVELGTKLSGAVVGISIVGGLVSSLFFLVNPLLRYNQLNGQSYFFDAISNALGTKIDFLWPSMIEPSSTTGLQIGIIMAGLTLAYIILFHVKLPNFRKWDRNADCSQK